VDASRREKEKGMSTVQPRELSDVLETVKHWPPDARVSLARMILETVESPQVLGQTPEHGEPTRRGKPVDLLIGLGAGSGPPPSDDLVRQWIDEHRMEKYGS
jgi:hypothetical protein